MVNALCQCYKKTQGQNYAETVLVGQAQLGTFDRIHFKVMCEKGTGFTQEQFEDEDGFFKKVQWKIVNVTKSITVNMDVLREPYHEKWITDNWIGDTVRVMPKLGCTELTYVELYVQIHYV